MGDPPHTTALTVPRMTGVEAGCACSMPLTLLMLTAATICVPHTPTTLPKQGRAAARQQHPPGLHGHTCCIVTGVYTWLALYIYTCRTRRLQCEKDRQTVYYQNIATAFPDLPAPNVLVKPQPYAPAEGQGQGQGSPSGHAAPDGPDGGDGALVSPGSGSGSGNNSLRRDASNVSAGNAAAALADLSLDNSLTLRRSVKK